MRYQSQLFDCMPSMRADLEEEMFVGNQSHLYDSMPSMSTGLEVGMCVRYQW